MIPVSVGDPRHAADRYAERTAKMVIFNHAQRVCKGACRKRKSVGQFARGDDLCKTCRLRA
jgi:hypothetical protein